MLCTPFSDPNAHGSIAGLSFRRRYGSVILEKKPFPVQPNSAGQIAQRNAFKTANNEWYALTSMTRDYYNARGPVYNLNGRTLYIRQKLRGVLPSTTLFSCKTVTNANITTTIMTSPKYIQWRFDTAGPNAFGHIYDPGNSYTNVWTATSQELLRLYYIRTNPADPIVPMWYSIYIWFTDWNNNPQEGLIRYPEITGLAGYIGYVADDYSVWWDQACTQLVCTPLF